MKIILIGLILSLTINIEAMDKNFSYRIINQCKYDIDKTGKYDTFIAGVILGLSVGYKRVLEKSNIDNDYASLTPGEYEITMCKWALNFRRIENKKTSGKYDVTQFYFDLQDIGYMMTLPDSNKTH